MMSRIYKLIIEINSLKSSDEYDELFNLRWVNGTVRTNGNKLRDLDWLTLIPPGSGKSYW